MPYILSTILYPILSTILYISHVTHHIMPHTILYPMLSILNPILSTQGFHALQLAGGLMSLQLGGPGEAALAMACYVKLRAAGLASARWAMVKTPLIRGLHK